MTINIDMPITISIGLFSMGMLGLVAYVLKEPDKFEKVFEALDQAGIDVLRMTEEDDDGDIILTDEDEEVEVEDAFNGTLSEEVESSDTQGLTD